MVQISGFCRAIHIYYTLYFKTHNLIHQHYFQEVEIKGRPDAQGLDFADDMDNAAVVQAQRKKRPKKTGQVVLNVEGTQNEELRALEAHMLKLSKMGESFPSINVPYVMKLAQDLN